MGETITLRPEFRGPICDLFSCRDPEVMLSGPAGTGKSVGIWHKLHAVLCKYPGARVLAMRKTLTDLTASGIVTFERHVLHAAEGVTFFGGSSREPASYRYPNGSRLVVGGMDRATKVLSSEYDVIYIQEATEVTVEEWELCSTRLRNGVVPYQQMLGDCNPDAPTHWIKTRAAEGKLTLFETRHEHNPHYFDADSGEPTEAGRTYIARLDNLTGVRYKRYRLGLWVAAEGQVYEEFDPAVHVIAREELPPPSVVDSWPRLWSVDFGFTNPLVWQEWAQDGDGRLYRLREFYKTQTLVQDAVSAILRACLDAPRPRAILCDHDAEDRATFEAYSVFCKACDRAIRSEDAPLHQGHEIVRFSLTTTAAYKSVSPGIQAVAERLKVAGDGRPRLYYVADPLIHAPDPLLIDAKKPTRSEDEVASYVWDLNDGRKKGEAPVKEYDHGQDAKRYAVAYADNLREAVKEKTVGYDPTRMMSSFNRARR